MCHHHPTTNHLTAYFFTAPVLAEYKNYLNSTLSSCWFFKLHKRIAYTLLFTNNRISIRMYYKRSIYALYTNLTQAGCMPHRYHIPSLNAQAASLKASNLYLLVLHIHTTSLHQTIL